MFTIKCYSITALAAVTTVLGAALALAPQSASASPAEGYIGSCSGTGTVAETGSWAGKIESCVTGEDATGQTAASITWTNITDEKSDSTPYDAFIFRADPWARDLFKFHVTGPDVSSELAGQIAAHVISPSAYETTQAIIAPGQSVTVTSAKGQPLQAAEINADLTLNHDRIASFLGFMTEGLADVAIDEGLKTFSPQVAQGKDIQDCIDALRKYYDGQVQPGSDGQENVWEQYQGQSACAGAREFILNPEASDSGSKHVKSGGPGTSNDDTTVLKDIKDAVDEALPDAADGAKWLSEILPDVK